MLPTTWNFLYSYVTVTLHTNVYSHFTKQLTFTLHDNVQSLYMTPYSHKPTFYSHFTYQLTLTIHNHRCSSSRGTSCPSWRVNFHDVSTLTGVQVRAALRVPIAGERAAPRRRRLDRRFDRHAARLHPRRGGVLHWSFPHSTWKHL